MDSALRVASRYLTIRTACRVVARFLEARSAPHQRGWEHRKEKDEFTENNIPAELRTLWPKLKNKFKGTPDQRYEHFMEYVEEHPNEVSETLEKHSEKQVAKLLREQAKAYKEQAKQQKLEQACQKVWDKYKDALKKERDRESKERERAEKEQSKLNQLKQKAESSCKDCPTCDSGLDADLKTDPYEDVVPF